MTGEPEPTVTTTSLPPTTVIRYIQVPENTSTTVAREPWNPAEDGLSFTDVIGIATLVTLLIGIYVAVKRFRKEREQAQEETIRRLIGELKPPLDKMQYELSNNGGSSMKDRSDFSASELKTIRADVASVSRDVNKLTTQVDFWVRHTVQRDEAAAKLSERVAALEGPLTEHPDRAATTTRGLGQRLRKGRRQ